ncbi:MAG TPA: zinc ribbon domain-containing protein, partial [Acidimicrobiales bacterium]|nr:zinc ribbon domain-containing protein [Acidimicrobiales bacterium]
MRCPTCGSGNPDGKRFCEDCGGSLLAICPACGAQLTAGKRFCGDCGAPVGAATALQPVPAAPVQKAQSRQAVLPPTTEVRQVSVLFCDLVGFTPLSESRDPEDVRALLSGYFDLSRSIVSRYGGIVEK